MESKNPNYKKFNKGDKKPYNKKPRVKKENNIIFFERSFETLSDMVAELKSLHPEIREKILPYEDENVTSDNLISDVLNYYSNNIPDVVNCKNLICSLNVTASKVALKTNKFFTLEWKFKFDKNGFITDIVSTISVVTREKNSQVLDDMLDILKDNWVQVENKFNK